MDEIEAKKRKVFMTAFEKINIGLKNYFSKLTGGGEATLKLETQKTFSRGIDMIVQFPNNLQLLLVGRAVGDDPSRPLASFSH